MKIVNCINKIRKYDVSKFISKLKLFKNIIFINFFILNLLILLILMDYVVNGDVMLSGIY